MSTQARSDPDAQERHRTATYDAIVAAARTLLAQRRELTVRGIAAEMGVSPAGLYRYVANLDELRELVAASIDEALRAELADAVGALGPDDVTSRWLVAWIRLRRWALTHPDEFGLVTTRPRDGQTPPCELSSAFLGECLRALATNLGVRLPTVPRAIEPALAGLARRSSPDEWPAALTWLHVRILASLHGVIALEVTGYLDPVLVADAAVFRTTIVEWLARLVRADQLSGLLVLLDAELAS